MTEAREPRAPRRAGVLLHVTSLPTVETAGDDGTTAGDLGDEAYRFVDFLAAAGCTVWQVLPLVPTHDDDGSPYNAVSSMAGNPDLISHAHRAAAGLDDATALDEGQAEAFGSWCADQADWLEPYVEFVALRELHGNRPWSTWPAALRDREPEAVAGALARCPGPGRGPRLQQGVFARPGGRLHACAPPPGGLA